MTAKTKDAAGFSVDGAASAPAIVSRAVSDIRAPFLAILFVCSSLCAQERNPYNTLALNPTDYEFSGSKLTRAGGQVIGCTEPGGTGEIRYLARGPYGTIYLAAENGLFSLTNYVSHTTPLPLLEGAPKGEPTRVEVDANGTIWLWTKAGFGCVEPVHLFGHTRDKPGISFDAIAKAPLPTLEVVSADESPVDGVIRVRVKANASGDLVYAWRLRKRHRFIWQRSPEFELKDIEPGKHDLDFVVFDEFLRRSKAQRVRVSVPYPKTYSKAVALPAILGAALLLLCAFFFAARRGGGGRVRYTKAVLSTILVIVVGLQVLAGLFPHARGWPFVGFSMYSQRYDEGEHVYKGIIRGVSEDGEVFKLDPAVAGFPSDGYWQALLPLVYDGDETCQRFLDAYRQAAPQRKMKGFIISDDKHRLTVEGPIRVAPVVMRVYPKGLVWLK